MPHIEQQYQAFLSLHTLHCTSSSITQLSVCALGPAAPPSGTETHRQQYTTPIIKSHLIHPSRPEGLRTFNTNHQQSGTSRHSPTLTQMIKVLAQLPGPQPSNYTHKTSTQSKPYLDMHTGLPAKPMHPAMTIPQCARDPVDCPAKNPVAKHCS